MHPGMMCFSQREVNPSDRQNSSSKLQWSFGAVSHRFLQQPRLGQLPWSKRILNGAGAEQKCEAAKF